MKKFDVLGKDLLEGLLDEDLVSVTLSDRYSSMNISSMNGDDLLVFIDPDSEYSVTVYDCDEEYNYGRHQFYDIEITGRIVK